MDKYGKKADERNNPIPVVLMVRCEEDQADAVEKILEEHQALGLARHYVRPAEGSSDAGG